METIYALATARGKAGVAVVRISGTGAHAAVTRLGAGEPVLRKPLLRILKDADGVPLDEALVLYFEKGASFTGEQVAELHLHGSIATVNAILRVLSDDRALRLAEPGEFTRRALENGRLDLAQVEGLSDLIEAETEAQRLQALKTLSGALGDLAETWRIKLVRAAALLEATIDFADEDVPVDVSPEVNSLIDDVLAELHREEAGSRVAERIREGFEVAILGAPNAGKSTLLNALAGRDAAITSDIAGTTRDVIEVRMDLRGLPVTMLDTAGLRDTDDIIEGIGIERAVERAMSADLRIFLRGSENIELVSPQEHDIVVWGKSDLGGPKGTSVSGKTGEGVDALISKVADILEQRASGASTATHERHRIAVVRGIEALGIAKIEVSHGSERAEIAAEELRTAIRTLDSLVGRVDVEHLLDEIFASFCLGK